MEINNFSGRIFSNPKIPINHWVIKELSTADESLFTDPKKVNRGIQLLASVEAKLLKSLGSKSVKENMKTRETR